MCRWAVQIVTPFVGVWIEIGSFSSSTIPCASLPLWECGLKSKDRYIDSTGKQSLPLWECGLKFVIPGPDCKLYVVTPFVGVWIEIDKSIVIRSHVKVTPFVGVWIEISGDSKRTVYNSSHSLCGSVD